MGVQYFLSGAATQLTTAEKETEINASEYQLIITRSVDVVFHML